MILREATINDIDLLTHLFDGYRMFYKQASDIPGAKAFLSSRFSNNESVIYIALLSDGRPDTQLRPMGFTQLYPIFSSVTMQSMYVLNDLFVLPEYRGKGVGTALIDTVKERCRQEKQKGIALQTEKTNPAQKLYEHLGFIQDPDLQYFWATQY